MKIQTLGPYAIFHGHRSSFLFAGDKLQEGLWRVVFDQMTYASPLKQSMHALWDFITQARKGHGPGLRHSPFGHNRYNCLGGRHFIGERLLHWSLAHKLVITDDEGKRERQVTLYDLLRFSFCLAQLQGYHNGTDACYSATQCGEWGDATIEHALDQILATLESAAVQGYAFFDEETGDLEMRDTYNCPTKQAARDKADALECVITLGISAKDRETYMSRVSHLFTAERTAPRRDSIFMPDAQEHVIWEKYREGTPEKTQWNWMGYTLTADPRGGRTRQPLLSCDGYEWDDLEDAFEELRRDRQRKIADEAMCASDKPEDFHIF